MNISEPVAAADSPVAAPNATVLSAKDAQESVDRGLSNTLILAGIIAGIFFVLFLLFRRLLKHFYSACLCLPILVAPVFRFLIRLLWFSFLGIVISISFKCFFVAIRAIKFRHKFKRRPIRPPSRGCFSWIRPTLFIDDETFLKTHGLDSFMYISFLICFTCVFAVSFIFNWIILLPVDGSGPLRNLPPDSPRKVYGLSIISIANIDSVDSGDRWRLLAHVLSVLVSSLSVYIGITWLYRRYLFCRMRILNSRLPCNYTVRVEGIGPTENKQTLDEFFEKLFPGAVSAVHIVPHTSSERGYLEKMDMYDQKLEELKYDQRHGDVSENEKVRAVPSCMVCLPANSCCCCFDKRDAENYYQERIESYRKKIVKHDGQLKPTSVAYITFKTIYYARLCVRTVMGRVKSISAWKVTPAPDPDDVLWGNHEIGPISRVIRRLLIAVASFFSIVLWIVPTTFAVSLANTTVVSSLSVFSFLENVVSIKSLIGIIEGIIPPIIIFISAEILLVWLTFLTHRFEGHRSRSTEILSLLIKYYCFQIVDIFLPSLLGGSLLGIVDQLVQLLQRPLSLIDLLAISVPRQVNFFINYVALQSVVRNVMALVRPLSLLYYLFRRLCCCRCCRATTKREKKELHEPPEFDYASAYSTDLLIATMGLVYSSIAAIIVPFALFYFGLGWICSRYNLIFVYHQKSESWGTLLPNVVSMSLATLLIYQVTLLGIFVINNFLFGSIVTGIMIGVTAIFWITIHKIYYKRTMYGILDPSLNGDPANAFTDLGPHFSFILHDDEETASGGEDETMEEEDKSRNLLPLEIVYEDPIVREIRLIKTQNDSMTGRKLTRRRLRQGNSELASLAASLGATSSKIISFRGNEEDDIEKPPKRSGSSASSDDEEDQDRDSTSEGEEMKRMNGGNSTPESDTGPSVE